MAPLDEPAWCNGAATWLTPEARHFLCLMALCDDAMFSVLLMEPSGACSILFVSPGVTRLLGYSGEEYLALGCARGGGAAGMRIAPSSRRAVAFWRLAESAARR